MGLLLAGLSMTQAFLQPHPGPVALGGLLESTSAG
jgi:GntP family gluconate:H+ symporter